MKNITQYSLLFAAAITLSTSLLMSGCSQSGSIDMPKKKEMSSEVNAPAGPANSVDARIAYVQRQIQSDPDNSQLWTALGVLAVQKGAMQNAINSFRKAVELDDNNADAYFGLANLSLQNRELQTAVSLYRKVLSIEPGHKGAQQQINQIAQALKPAAAAQK